MPRPDVHPGRVFGKELGLHVKLAEFARQMEKSEAGTEIARLLPPNHGAEGSR